MSQTLRWSQAELNAYLVRTGRSPPSEAALSTGRPNPTVAMTKGVTESAITPPRKGRRARAIESLQRARVSGEWVPDRFLELRFDGVLPLSVNSLLALTHFERIRYRKAWHIAIDEAVLEVTSGDRRRVRFDHFIVRSHRTTRRLSDTDAKEGVLKYAIDGLRYAGVIAEDTQAHFRDLLCSQSIGPPALVLRIEAVSDDYRPMAERDGFGFHGVQRVDPRSLGPMPIGDEAVA